MIRARLILATVFTGFGILLGLLFVRINPRQVTVTLPAPASRNPAVAAQPVTEPARLCQNIYRAVCQKGVVRDPTGSVRPDIEGEIQILRLQEEIMRKHPEWASEKVDEELVRLVYTPTRRARIHGAFVWVQKAIERFIDEQPGTVFSPSQKARIKERIIRTKLELPPPVEIYNDEPEVLTKNDAFYERLQDGSMRLRVGGAYLFTSKSWFNLIFTLGHELGHAIDPCELRNAGIRVTAIDRLSRCFINQGLVAARPSRQECGANDQLSETFSDWLGVHITAEALAEFSKEFKGTQLINAATNSVRDLCEQEDDGLSEPDIEFHPSPHVRIDRIFGRNPAVRNLLGCGPVETGPGYCQLTPAETPDPVPIPSPLTPKTK